jgi:hypothetical protein
VNAQIDEANALLRGKGYRERELGVFPTPMGPDRALLKGDRILSPFSDSAETVLRVVRELVPPAGELKGTIRPTDLRRSLA